MKRGVKVPSEFLRAIRVIFVPGLQRVPKAKAVELPIFVAIGNPFHISGDRLAATARDKHVQGALEVFPATTNYKLRPSQLRVDC